MIIAVGLIIAWFFWIHDKRLDQLEKMAEIYRDTY